MMDATAASFVALGASRNAHGRIHEPGKAYNLPVKLEVAEKYENLKNAKAPSARALAAACKEGVSDIRPEDY